MVVQIEAGWVMVESNAIWHLYGDLSELAVSQGETVETGDRLGVGCRFTPALRGAGGAVRAGDHRSPQFDLHTNARMRMVAPGGSAEEGAAEPSGATVEP